MTRPAETVEPAIWPAVVVAFFILAATLVLPFAAGVLEPDLIIARLPGPSGMADGSYMPHPLGMHHALFEFFHNTLPNVGKLWNDVS